MPRQLREQRVALRGGAELATRGGGGASISAEGRATLAKIAHQEQQLEELTARRSASRFAREKVAKFSTKS